MKTFAYTSSLDKETKRAIKIAAEWFLIGVLVGVFSSGLTDKLKKYKYALYRVNDSVSRLDRYATIDNDDEQAAHTNCMAIWDWHRKLYPESEPLECIKE